MGARKKNRRIKNKEPMGLLDWIASIINGLFIWSPQQTEVYNVANSPQQTEVYNVANTPTTNKRALLIGSNYSGTSAPLNGCINDLDNMKSFLQGRGFTDIRMVSDDERVKKPTEQIILKELTDFLAKSNTGELLYLHFSGHGTQQISYDRYEDDHLDEVICTYEADKTISYINDNRLNQIIKENLHKEATLYAVFDCCHSGSMLDLKYTYKYALTDWICSDTIKETDKCGHIIMMSGCCDDQTSADAEIETNYQGALTYALLNALTNNKIIRNVYYETLRYLCENNYYQYPLLSTNKPFATTTCEFLQET